MSKASAVALVDGSGYVVRLGESDKLETTWILTEEEATEAVDRLNFAAEFAKHRPDANDPEVQALINDPEFAPVEYEDVEVPDLLHSTIVYLTKPGPKIIEDDSITFGPDEIKYDETGQPMIDWQASEIVTKPEKHPKRVSGFGRIEAAVSQVARKRMEEARTSTTSIYHD